MITLHALWKHHEIVEKEMSSEELGFWGYSLFGICDGRYKPIFFDKERKIL